MLEEVGMTIREHRMLAIGDGVVVAVSGGVDSMVLLYVLTTLRPSLGLRLQAAHLDHGLRGPEAERDAAAVAAWAARLDVPLTVECAGPLDRRGGSLQRAARIARYAFLHRVADRLGAQRIAMGHNRDDVAETLLLNLLRGAGLRGLAAIPPVRGRIIRPLLTIPRDTILTFARAHRVPWREDPSNRTTAYRRNHIRAELIPALAKDYNPRILESLARTAAILRAEEAFLETLAREALAKMARPARAGGTALRGNELAGLDAALRRRVLREAVEGLPGRPVLPWRHLARLDSWTSSGPRAGRCDLPHGMAGWWEGGDLILAPKAAPLPAEAVALSLEVPTRVAALAMTFLAETAEVGPGARLSQGPGPAGQAAGGSLEAWLDAAAAPDRLTVRGWRPGDRFQPLGLAGTKKLQDFFVDAKVPRWARWRVPLVVSGDRILWVVGHRIDERARITAATRRVLHLTARPDGLAMESRVDRRRSAGRGAGRTFPAGAPRTEDPFGGFSHIPQG